MQTPKGFLQAKAGRLLPSAQREREGARFEDDGFPREFQEGMKIILSARSRVPRGPGGMVAYRQRKAVRRDMIVRCEATLNKHNAANGAIG